MNTIFKFNRLLLTLSMLLGVQSMHGMYTYAPSKNMYEEKPKGFSEMVLDTQEKRLSNMLFQPIYNEIKQMTIQNFLQADTKKLIENLNVNVSRLEHDLNSERGEEILRTGNSSDRKTNLSIVQFFISGTGKLLSNNESRRLDQVIDKLNGRELYPYVYDSILYLYNNIILPYAQKNNIKIKELHYQ